MHVVNKKKEERDRDQSFADSEADGAERGKSGDGKIVYLRPQSMSLLVLSFLTLPLPGRRF